jgi:predicted ATPase
VFEPSSVDVQTGATTRTPIIGREREIAQVTALIDEPGNALVTLLGPGGIGKTRLAIEIAQRIGGDFADGATFVPLASVREASLVPLQVARTLGLQESGDLSAEDNLTRLLRSQHRLLVLDNMEQVIDAASPWLSNLLHNSPRLKVVVTSRLALNIEGEQRFVVPPLETPAAGATMPPSTSAVDLFTRQARRFDSQFALNKANADVVAEICRRVHGFPLAIELAAARTGVLSPQAILDRLAARTAPLTSPCMRRLAGAMTCSRNRNGDSSAAWQSSSARSASTLSDSSPAFPIHPQARTRPLP